VSFSEEVGDSNSLSVSGVPRESGHVSFCQEVGDSDSLTLSGFCPGTGLVRFSNEFGRSDPLPISDHLSNSGAILGSAAPIISWRILQSCLLTHTANFRLSNELSRKAPLSVILSPLESSIDSSLVSVASTWTATGIGIGAFVIIITVIALCVLRRHHFGPEESRTEMEEAVEGAVRENIDGIRTDHVLELASYENALEAPAGSHRLTQVDFSE
jgi:hypothetical protein